jgi:hypothetical protein
MTIEMYTAYTPEIDDIDDALDDLLQQIDLTALKQNSLALVNCYYDFLETGVYDALVDKLPFDVIGCTTMASASHKDLGQYRLNLTILTSDDARFVATITKPLANDSYAKSIQGAYAEARASLNEEPAMLLDYFPFSSVLSVSDMLTALDSACKGAPVFGSIPSGINMNYDGCRVFLNHDIAANQMAVALLAGDFTPDFMVTHIPNRNIREGRFTVTKSDGCMLYEINNIPAAEYFASLGLQINALNRTTVPFILYPSGSHSSVAIAAYSANDDGSLLFGAPVPVGMTMAIGEIDPEGIISTGMDNLEAMLLKRPGANVLLSPCVTRYIMLAPNQDEEMVAVSERLADKLPYALNYAGGELCPIKDDAGVWHNQFHNFSFPICVF